MMAYRPQQPFGDRAFGMGQRNTSPLSQRLMMEQMDRMDRMERMERIPMGQHPVGYHHSPDIRMSANYDPRHNMMMQQAAMNARLRAQQAQQEAQVMQQYLHTQPPPHAMAAAVAARRPMQQYPMVQTNQSIRSPSPHGLDLLRSVSLTMPHDHMDRSYGPAGAPGLSAANSAFAPIPKPQFGVPGVPAGMELKIPPPSMQGRCIRETDSTTGQVRLYIDEILEWDVLCGRGGRSNHHPGNKRYRHVVSEMKAMYRTTEAKNLKTDLSRAIVEHVCNYGGRFIKKCEKTGRYYVLTKAEARKKTSQALRETKELKWTL